MKQIAREAITLGLMMFDPERSPGVDEQSAFDRFGELREQFLGENTFAEADMKEEELEEVTLEEESGEPEKAPEPFAEVQALLDETNLPDASKTRLLEREHEDEEAAKDAIQAEIAYVKELTGSGRPTGLGGSEKPKPLTEEEKLEEFNKVMLAVGAPTV